MGGLNRHLIKKKYELALAYRSQNQKEKQKRYGNLVRDNYSY